MTNPDNAIGTNGAYGGRTSVNAFNDVLSAFRDINAGAGILSGWEAEINDAQQLELGGKNKVRDVAIAEDPNGNLTTIDNISGVPIALDLPAPPITGTRYDMIVAYVTSPSEGTDKVVDNPQACGIIVVDGGETGMIGSAIDETIRQAITQDGAAGTTAYYVVLCQVLRTVGQVVISPGNIFPGKDRNMGGKFPVVAQDIDWSTFGNQQNYIDLGKIRLQWGSNRREWGKNNDELINLPQPFANTDYKVFTQIKQPSGDRGSFTALTPLIVNPTTTNFTLNVWNESDNRLTFTFDWFAVGIAP